jgi:hypothetical protein
VRNRSISPSFAIQSRRSSIVFVCTSALLSCLHIAAALSAATTAHIFDSPIISGLLTPPIFVRAPLNLIPFGTHPPLARDLSIRTGVLASTMRLLNV